jgi:RNA polymerase sigma-70 factor (ECF subfamily)
MASSPDSRVAPFQDPVFLQDLRRQMLRFATLQLSDAHLAEDAVQEALIGALKSADRFGGRAALKTWVFAILKNKIADVLRQRQRLWQADHLLRADEDGEDLHDLFYARGFWQPVDAISNAMGQPPEAVRAFLDSRQGRHFADYGIPRALPYLMGFVIHCEIVEE